MYATSWNDTSGVLVTRLASPATAAEVLEWKASLDESVERLPDGSTFKLLVDIRGYEASENAEAHRLMREVVPLFLARHGMRPAVLDLFPEATVEVTAARGVICTAFANVHHDEGKMATYEKRLGRDDQRFFTDPIAADEWLRTAGAAMRRG
jgi:hypothetical protein